MSIASESQIDKPLSLINLAHDLQQLVARAAAGGDALYLLERQVLDSVLAMGHTAVEMFLSHQGDGDLGETVIDEHGKKLHRSDEPQPRPLRTIFGEHQFSAFVYRARKHANNKIVLRPTDQRLGLSPHTWSFLLEEFSQLFCVEQAFQLAADNFQNVFRQQLSVDTLEKTNLRMGQEAAGFLNQLAPPPATEEGEILVATADGKGVPLVRNDAAKLKCFEDKPQRPGNRRMATVASVYSVDRHIRTPEDIVDALFRDKRKPTATPCTPRPTPCTPRPTPCHKRVVARFPQVFEDIDETKPISGAVVALSWVAGEVHERRQPGQLLVRLMDGQHSLWDVAAACLDGVPADETVEILDIVHVAGYVWRAAKAFHNHKEHQEAFVHKHLLRILRGEVRSVITNLRRMATRHSLSGKLRTEIDTVCGYFAGHAERMKYDEYLARGCPIATGVIEGACRHLVKDRMERSGMRWTLEGAQAMLEVRSIQQSAYWKEFHKQRAATTQDTQPTLKI